MLKMEIRADGVHISGYVNATEKKSRPVITPHGKVIEVIVPRAFAETQKPRPVNPGGVINCKQKADCTVR